MLLAWVEAEAYDCHHHDSESKRRRGEDDHSDKFVRRDCESWEAHAANRSGSASEFDDRVLRYGRDRGVDVRGAERKPLDDGAGDQADERSDAVFGSGEIGS